MAAGEALGVWLDFSSFIMLSNWSRVPFGVIRQSADCDCYQCHLSSPTSSCLRCCPIIIHFSGRGCGTRTETEKKELHWNCTGTALELHWNCTGTARSVKNTQKCSEFLRLEICPETALPEEHTETALKLLGQLKTLRSALKVLWIPSTRNLPWNCSARGTHRNCTETALNLLKLEIQTSKHYLLWDRHETVPEPPQNRSVSRTRKKINQEKTAPRAELERHFSLTARPAEYGHYEHPTPEQKTGISHRKETNKSRINQCVDVWIYDGHISGGGGLGSGERVSFWGLLKRAGCSHSSPRQRRLHVCLFPCHEPVAPQFTGQDLYLFLCV